MSSRLRGALPAYKVGRLDEYLTLRFGSKQGYKDYIARRMYGQTHKGALRRFTCDCGEAISPPVHVTKIICQCGRTWHLCLKRSGVYNASVTKFSMLLPRCRIIEK